MNVKVRLLSIALLSAPLLYISLCWDRLPDRLALHFDQNGQVDKMGSRLEWLNSLFVTVLLFSLLRSVLLSLLSRQSTLTTYQRVMLDVLTAGFIGGALVLLLIQGIQGAPVYRDWGSVLFFSLGSGLIYYGVPPDLPIDSKQTPTFNLPLARALAFRQRMHVLSRLVTTRVNFLAVILMFFLDGQDRWSAGILANLLSVFFLAGLSVYLRRHDD